MSELLAFCMWMVSQRHPDCLERYVDAIEAATPNHDERLVLAVLAKHENWFHCGSHEAPFGLSDWAASHHRRPTIEEAAPIALGGLRSLVRRCGSWPAALGHWHHGTQEPGPGPWTRAHPRTNGCWSDWLSHWEMSSLYNWRWNDAGAHPTRGVQPLPFGRRARWR